MQLIDCAKLEHVIGRKFRSRNAGHRFDLIPLPHPPARRPGTKILPGQSTHRAGAQLIAGHPCDLFIELIWKPGITNFHRELFTLFWFPGFLIIFFRSFWNSDPADVPETDKWDSDTSVR